MPVLGSGKRLTGLVMPVLGSGRRSTGHVMPGLRVWEEVNRPRYALNLRVREVWEAFS